MIRSCLGLCVTLGLLGCKSAGAAQAAAAAITLGAAVAAAAINRAATDDCWGNCPPGTYCDSDSGLCVAPAEGQAMPPEPEAEWIACDRERFQCLDDLWLRCELPCEWVMCEPREGDAGEPRRCCEQRCEWLLCPDDGRPCRQLEREPKKRGEHAGPPPDPCRGLCLAAERCVVRDGVADCVGDAP